MSRTYANSRRQVRSLVPALRGIGRRAARGRDWVDRVGGHKLGGHKNWVEKSARTLSLLFPPTRGPPMEASVPGGAHLLAHRAGAPLAARTGGQCSSRVGLASYARTR